MTILEDHFGFTRTDHGQHLSRRFKAMAQRVATGGHGAVTSGLVASTSLHGNGGATYISNDDDEDDNEWHELHELEAQLANETQNNEDFAPSRNIGNGARYAQVPTDENDDKLEHKAGSRLNAPPSNDDPALAMVRAVVKETDDPSLPNVTFRVLLLGTILCAVGAAVSQLFFVRAGVFNVRVTMSNSVFLLSI